MRNVLTLAITACLTAPAIHAEEASSSAYGADDSFDLAVEPCPDKFDKAWAKTNDADEPCLNTRTQELQMPDGSPLVASPESNPAPQQRPSVAPVVPETDQAEEMVCREENLSDQAVAQSDYRAALDRREDGNKTDLGAFEPSAEVALSLRQLLDDDIRPDHIEATFNALDDNDSGAVDRIESLDVRGLADVFERADLNEDRVISAAEFHLYFDVELDDPYCLDGAQITSIDELEEFDSINS